MSERKIRQSDGLLMNNHDPVSGPILPMEGQRNVLITSALPTANNVPHLGNIIGSTLSADVFARYSRTLNVPTLFVCGTDEYGTSAEIKGLEQGVTPLEICEKYHKLHTEIYEWFDISFDIWGRTTTQEHNILTQEMYKNIYDRGYFRLETKQTTYCEDDKLFLWDKFVEGICPRCQYTDARGNQCDNCGQTFTSPTLLLNPRCKRNKTHKLSLRPSSQACLPLDRLQPDLERWIQKARARGKWANNAVVTDQGEFIEPTVLEGLKPYAMTRDLNWGIEVPKVGDKEVDESLDRKVFFVWFDAPIGYLSITAGYTDKWREWWLNPEHVELYQFMGKDNVYFHAVLFPAMQIADGRNWTMVHNISSTQYLNYEGTKFSKSRNVGLYGDNAQATGLSASVWRYYLLSTRPETIDSSFEWGDFIRANNENLVNNLGRFVYQVIGFVNENLGSIVPGPNELVGGEIIYDISQIGGRMDRELINDINTLLIQYRSYIDETKLRDGLATAVSISTRGNQYLQDSDISQLLSGDRERCAEVILNAVNLIYLLSVMIHPFMPAISSDILRQLNAPARNLPNIFSIDILPGHKLGKAEIMFEKIDNTDGKQEKAWQQLVRR